MSSPWMLTDRFAEAVAYAHEAHAGHTRKGTGVPYIAHLLAVCSLVLEGGGDEDQAIAALLHDTAEDHPLPASAGSTGGQARVEDVRERFGDRVAGMVEALSDTLDKHNERRTWCRRKHDYLDHLSAGGAGEPHVLISVADKLHNSRSIVRDLRAADDPADVWRRFTGRRTGTCWY
ncbi:MAG TPA: HD domain-containing protein, partial [Nitriliruptorales bacterium]